VVLRCLSWVYKVKPVVSPPLGRGLGGGSASARDEPTPNPSQEGNRNWHPAFLALGATLDLCAAAYRKFCERYRPKPKPEIKNHWGSKLLEKLIGRKRKPDKKSKSPGQLKLWDEWEAPSEIHEVAAQFIRANCFDPTPNFNVDNR